MTWFYLWVQISFSLLSVVERFPLIISIWISRSTCDEKCCAFLVINFISQKKNRLLWPSCSFKHQCSSLYFLTPVSKHVPKFKTLQDKAKMHSKRVQERLWGTQLLPAQHGPCQQYRSSAPHHPCRPTHLAQYLPLPWPEAAGNEMRLRSQHRTEKGEGQYWWCAPS